MSSSDALGSQFGDRERLPVVTLKPFEDVVTEYGAVVLRFCRAVVGPVDAEDAWSETFIAAMRAYPDLNPDANIEKRSAGHPLNDYDRAGWLDSLCDELRR